ncbi:MAG: 1-acyl-sn-glycerol-3-phosphate acyltransferase [Cyanobacteria bacterium]|nr:1-acyl-sn-glycerol-3-phosphate acyltransferase [Cyanobacteriota bacterium]
MFDPARHVRPNTMDFKPPKPNALLIGLMNMLLPWVLSSKALLGLKIAISDADLQKLKAIKGQRCLILPNHPTEFDPCVIFDLARRLKESFFFVAAREVFDYSYGVRGWLFQHLGVYSLVRGANDRASLKTSIDTLASNKGRLVIFVEGEISSQNETLLPLESGVLQLGMMALNEARKAQQSESNASISLNASPSLFVCPISIVYHYDTAGLEAAVQKALYQLESAVGIDSGNSTAKTKHERLQILASKTLQDAAKQVGYGLNPEASAFENTQGLQRFLIEKIEHLLNLSSDNTVKLLDRVRQVRIKVDQILGQTDETQLTPYQSHLFQHQKDVLRNLYSDLERVVNFISLYDGYLSPESLSLDRTVEMIRRLEREVFGVQRFLHPRTAHVRVGGPIDLKDHWESFQNDKKGTIKTLTATVEHVMREGLLQPNDAPSNN